jgi:putative ATP-binding cassette transporter
VQIFTLFKREITQPKNPLIIFSALVGISNAFLLGVINSAAETIANNNINWKLSILYALSLGIFFFSKRYVMDRSSEIVETVINRLRRRLADKVRHTELSTMEKYGTSSIYARISQDATIISNTSTMIINGSQQALMTLFVLLYIASVSLWSFLMIAIGLAIGILYYVGHSETFRAMWKEVSVKETQFFEKLGHILQGFKEININRRKNEAVFQNYTAVNDELRDYRVKTSKHYNITLSFTEVFFYLLLGVILFVLPKLHAEHSEAIIKVVASVLFVVGPLEGIIWSIPAFANANNSAGNIMELETQLEEELKKIGEERLDPDAPEAYLSLPFESRIELRGLSYQYPARNSGGAGFQVGPIELTIEKGDLIFVTGGNGSGKTTFLRLFTGLYKPTMGTIQLDGGEGKRKTTVTGQNYQQYQNLFTTIFSDYHLFDRLYGVEEEVDPEQVNALLESMGLAQEKVSYQNGAFNNIRLSSGQRKRLALTTAIMEDKDIYVFDEVAADLDPAFRDKFYLEILPELKGRNKTVLVVSHDQQYWMASDRLLHFHDGMMRELSREEVRSLVQIAVK